MDLRTVWIRAEDDVAELLLVEQPALRANRVGELGAGRRWRAADLAGRTQLMLLADRADDVGHGDVQPSDAIRPKPHTHRVVAAAEQVDLADAGNTRDRVVHVDRRVVREEIAVVAALRRFYGDDQQRKR